MRPLVVIGFLGSTLDASKFGPTRWGKWRPTVALAMHEDLRIDRFVMIHADIHARLGANLRGGRARGEGGPEGEDKQGN